MSTFLNFTGTLLKNLVSKPVTKNYPEEPAVYPERMRGRIVIDIDQCISCGLCVRSCPPRCITVDKNEGTWTINRFDCIACGYCASKCPKKCLKLIPGYQKPGRSKAAVTYHKSEEVMEAERKKAAEMAAKKAAALKAAKEKAAAAGAAAAAADMRFRLWKAGTWTRPCACITAAPSMTERSSILPTTAARRWSSSAAQA